MNSRETLILHTLKFKQLHASGSNFSGDIVDKLLKPIRRRRTRSRKRLCQIPLWLANEMEQLGGMIGLNKREIITMAITISWKRLAASLMNLMLCQRRAINGHAHA